MKNSTKLAIYNAIALLLVILVNFLSNYLPINGQTTGQISSEINVLFTPAGYVFSIWGLIYLLLVFWVIGLFYSSAGRDIANRVSYLFVINAFLNIGWIFFFHYEYFAWTLLIMVGLLFNLIYIYNILNDPNISRMWQIPFSIYLGWVTIATILNVGIVLKTFGYQQYILYEPLWTILLLIMSTLLAMWFAITKKDLLYPLVFVWAFIGIAVKRIAEYPAIGYTAIIMTIILVVFIVYTIFKNKTIKIVS
ncbi:tryptophan-rich sensory protein [Filobacillus milosensis]|uniref:Tryptophan-rich sensory protein n=1 Tax=Filobacillus milosensis TaxID=94137 RepID=A0A4Y8IRJ8_9BACI|nr:TspO/MBR family protein [Filobacillus milosensis]TFB24305.1 tryptophan-rich sensory protein [Filobacillus milosensis]